MVDLFQYIRDAKDEPTEPKAKQLTFPHPMECTHIYKDGREEKVRYGYFESIAIIAENGHPIGHCVLAIVPSYYVEEVTKVDGTKVVFDKPWFLHTMREYGDGSGRKARSRYEYPKD